VERIRQVDEGNGLGVYWEGNVSGQRQSGNELIPIEVVSVDSKVLQDLADNARLQVPAAPVGDGGPGVS
jgi:hypothetical protein